MECGWTPPSEGSPCCPPLLPDRSLESRKALANGLCLIFRAVTYCKKERICFETLSIIMPWHDEMLLPPGSGRP